MDEPVTKEDSELISIRAALARAWDSGWSTAAGCYWRKSRNPYSGELNDDDPEDYCKKHGGTATTLVCSVCP